MSLGSLPRSFPNPNTISVKETQVKHVQAINGLVDDEYRQSIRGLVKELPPILLSDLDSETSSDGNQKRLGRPFQKTKAIGLIRGKEFQMLWAHKNEEGKVFFSGFVASGTTQANRHLFRIIAPRDELWKGWTFHCTCKMVSKMNPNSEPRLCAHTFGVLYLFAGVQSDFRSPWKGKDASRFQPLTIHKAGSVSQKIFGAANYPTVDWFVKRNMYDSLESLLDSFCLATIEHASPTFDVPPGKVKPRAASRKKPATTSTSLAMAFESRYSFEDIGGPSFQPPRVNFRKRRNEN